MFWKLLLTAAVVYLAYRSVRGRWGGGAVGRGDRGRSRVPFFPRIPLPVLRLAAYGLLGLMLTGSALYLLRGWQQGRTVMEVQVVNANTGAVTTYLARRDDIEGRGFLTLEGRQVRLADVERMILVPAQAGSGPGPVR